MVFGDKDTGAYLPRLAWTDIVRHTLVKGGAPRRPRPGRVLGTTPPEGETPCAVQAPVGCAVTPRMCTTRVWTSITNRTYRNWSSAVPTWRKSQARIPDAWAVRN